METLSVDCDTEIIAWTVNSPNDEKQGRIHAVSLGDHVMLIIVSGCVLGVKQYGSSLYCILPSSVLQYIAILQFMTRLC